MANKKTTKKNTKATERKSGFDAPAYGEIVPKGTTYKKLPDGTYRMIPPKGAKK